MSAMSEMAAETRLVGGGLSSLPRVNLMPPEIAEQAMMRKIKGGLVGAVVLAVGASAMLYLGATQSVSDAESSVAAAEAQQVTLQREKATFADVTAVYTQAAEAQRMLTQAMGQEVRYSRFLNDLSLSMPDNVWITNLTMTQTAPSAATGATAAAAPAALPTGLGTVTITGVAYEHNDVAAWLEALAQIKGFSNQPYLQNSTNAEIAERKVVNWSTTVDMTTAALSGRFTLPAGG